jgi:hypothetical protein
MFGNELPEGLVLLEQLGPDVLFERELGVGHALTPFVHGGRPRGVRRMGDESAAR